MRLNAIMIAIKKYLFIRASQILNRMADGSMQRFPVTVAVEAISKDHAIERLVEKWPTVDKMEWDFLEELDPEHDLGMLGETLKYRHVVN